MDDKKRMDLNEKIEEYVEKILVELFGEKKEGRIEGLSWLKGNDIEKKAYFDSFIQKDLDGEQRKYAKEILTTIVKLEVFHEKINKGSQEQNPALLDLWNKSKLSVLAKINKVKTDVKKRTIAGFKLGNLKINREVNKILRRLYSEKEAKKIFKEVSLSSFGEGVIDKQRLSSRLAIAMMESLKRGMDLRKVFSKDENYSRIQEQVEKEETMLDKPISSKKDFTDYQSGYTKSYDNALDFISASELTLFKDSKQDMEKIVKNVNQLLKDAIMKSDGSDIDAGKNLKNAVYSIIDKMQIQDGNLNYTKEDYQKIAEEAFKTINGLSLIAKTKFGNYSDVEKSHGIQGIVVFTLMGVVGAVTLTTAFTKNPISIEAWKKFLSTNWVGVTVLVGAVAGPIIAQYKKDIRKRKELLGLSDAALLALDRALDERQEAVSNASEVLSSMDRSQDSQEKDGDSKEF